MRWDRRRSDLGEMRAHGLCVGMWHDQSRPLQPVPGRRRRKCSSRYSGPVAGARGRATLGPDTGERALLAKARLHPETISQGLAAGCFRQGASTELRRSFFKSLLCIRADFGCCGRADRRRKPRLANCLPTVRSCRRMTPNALRSCVSDQCAASAQPHRPRVGNGPNHFRQLLASVPRSADRVDPAGDGEQARSRPPL